VIFGFFSSTNHFKKDHETQLVFLKDLVLYVIKDFLPMKIIKSIWLQQTIYKLCPKVIFPSKKLFMEEVLLALVEKTLVTFVQLALVTCLFTTCTFDMWMLARAHNMFVVVSIFDPTIACDN
jgi:hypothetical protein